VLLGAVIYGVVLIVSNAKVPLPASHGHGVDVMDPYPGITTLASGASITLETLSATLTAAVPTTILNTKKSEAPKVEVPEVEDPEIEIPNNDIPVDHPLATKEHPKFSPASAEAKPAATPTKAPLLPGILPIDPLHPNLKGKKENQPDQKNNNDDENEGEDDGMIRTRMMNMMNMSMMTTKLILAKRRTKTKAMRKVSLLYFSRRVNES